MNITTVGLGAWAIGGDGWETAWGPQDDSDSIATIVHSVECGVNWVDTAPIYGHGHSEEVVGRALAALAPDDRPRVFTKCGLWWNDADRMEPPARDTRRIRRELEHSLRRLGVDRVDLYQIHWPPVDFAVEEYWTTMLDLRAEGKGLGGRSVQFRHRTTECRRSARSRRQPSTPTVAAASLMPLRTRFRGALLNGTGVIVYSPLESGLLSGGYDAARVASLPPSDWRATAPQFTGAALQRNLAIVDAMRPIAARHEVSVASVAIAWTLAQPGVTAAIVGARRAEHVDGWPSAAVLSLTEADLAELDVAMAQRYGVTA
jgi:aryl-alcohol dehydrogenase-like predicted oxidoreductase